MAMTRDEVLAEMEASYQEMTDEEKDGFLFSEQGTDWTPTLLLEAVRSDTDFGKLYVESWAANKQRTALLDDLLAALLGGGGEGAMTCGDPDCPNCHGEVRPFDELPTGTDKH